MTKQEIYKELNSLHSKLHNTDYKAIKFAEGILNEEEYEETRLQRKEWRARINELEIALTHLS